MPASMPAKSFSRGCLAVALAAVAAALTACGPGGGPHTRAVAKPLTCNQQMTAWVKNTKAPFAAFNKAQDAVSRAADAKNVPATRSALEREGRAAKSAEGVAIPKCADPRGYYTKWLDRYVAAGDNARSQGGLSGLELAEEPLKGAPALRRKLNAELDRRTQYSGI